jgi:hypothetical protein
LATIGEQDETFKFDVKGVVDIGGGGGDVAAAAAAWW